MVGLSERCRGVSRRFSAFSYFSWSWKNVATNAQDADTTRRVVGWGPLSGSVGVGDEVDSTKPAEVVALRDRKLVAVASRSKHTLFLLDSGVVLSCGAANDYGQTGREAGGMAIPRAIQSLDAFVVRGPRKRPCFRPFWFFPLSHLSSPGHSGCDWG